MYENGGVQQVRDRNDKRIMRHEVRVLIESASVITFEELEVTSHVDNQKATQKKSRQRHDNLATEGAG